MENLTRTRTRTLTLSPSGPRHETSVLHLFPRGSSRQFDAHKTKTHRGLNTKGQLMIQVGIFYEIYIQNNTS